MLHKSCAYIAHWRKKYNLGQILRIYCALEKEVQSCAYIAHWRNKYNLAQILRIYWALGKEVQSCANLAHILRIDTSNAQLADLAQNTVSRSFSHHILISHKHTGKNHSDLLVLGEGKDRQKCAICNWWSAGCYLMRWCCSISYTANDSIYHFCFMIKDFFISFSRVIVVQDFETVTFYVLFVYKPTFSVIFCWMKRPCVSSQFNNLFISYISTAKPFKANFLSWQKLLATIFFEK